MRDQRGYDGSTVIVLRTLIYGIGIGAAWGIVAGTIIAPGLGTFFGLIGGFVIAVIPTLLGAFAIACCGRPGTEREVFARRIRWVTGTIGAAFVLIGIPIAGVRAAHGRSKAESYITTAVIIGGVLAIYLLMLATERLGRLVPAPAGTRQVGGWVILAVTFAFVGVVCAPGVWSTWLGPYPQHKREVGGLRDEIKDELDLQKSGWEKKRFNWWNPTSTGITDSDCSDGTVRFRSRGGGIRRTEEALTVEDLQPAVDLLQRRGQTVRVTELAEGGIIIRSEGDGWIIRIQSSFEDWQDHPSVGVQVSRDFSC